MYCPLANGRYATIKEENGILYLYIKTIERAHTPAKLWEKIELPDNLEGSLALINKHLEFWSRKFVNKVKERLVRLRQYVIRYRKWYYKPKPRLVVVHKKFERREKKRELRALIAAKLDFAIKAELLERLKQGTYEPHISLQNKEYMELLREEKRREYLYQRRHNIREGREKQGQEKRKEKEGKEKEEGGGIRQEGGVVDLDVPLDFVEAEDDYDVGDMEDLKALDNESIEDGDEDEDEDEQEEEEREKELELEAEAGIDRNDDAEMRRLKKTLVLVRKRKLEEKKKKEQKLAKDPLKRQKRYGGAHVEIEYEPTTSITQTSSVSW